MAVIEFENVAFSYAGRAPWLLENLSFAVNDGDYVSLLGENGCGKSTTLKMILGFLKPTAGRITVASPVSGYVPQADAAAMSAFPITPLEILRNYAKVCGADKDEAEKMLAAVNLTPYADRLIGTLSGGQRQRVLIARALIGQKHLLILDEPSTGLDAAAAKDVYGLLGHLNREHGVTILSVEHNLTAVRRWATKTVVFSGGTAREMTPVAGVTALLEGGVL